MEQTGNSRPAWTWVIGGVTLIALGAALVVPVILLNRALPNPARTSYDDLNRWISETRTSPGTPPPSPLTVIGDTTVVAMLGTDGKCWTVPVDPQGNPLVDEPQPADPATC